MAEGKVTVDGLGQVGILSEAFVLGGKISTPQTGEKIHFAAVPAGVELKSLAQFQYPNGIPPERIVAAPKFSDGQSFCGYVSSYQDDRLRVFADPVNTSFLAVLDYHGTGERVPEFLSHRASYAMKKDERWDTWAGKSEKVFTQSDFAEFIEDNMADVVEPSGADMLEIARDIKASIGGSFDSKVTLKNGAVQLKYVETVETKVGSGSIEIPDTFKISVPVFYGEQPVTITARLRYRINQGNLVFLYKLQRQNEVLQRAFDTAVAGVGEALKITVLKGVIG